MFDFFGDFFQSPAGRGDVSATSPRRLRDTAWRCLTHFSDHVTERVLASSNDRFRLRLYLFCEGRISVLKRWFKTPIQNAVNSGYCSSSSDFAFMLPPESAFCSNHDRKRTFLACVHAYFAKAFWNADSKRRSKTPFTEVLFMLPSRRRRYVYRRRHVSEFSECLIQAIVRAQVNRKGVYMTSFKRGYNVILRSCFHQNQRFALTTIVNAHFWAFWIGVLKRVYSKISMDATAFCSNHVWKRWFWPQ